MESINQLADTLVAKSKELLTPLSKPHALIYAEMCYNSFNREKLKTASILGEGYESYGNVKANDKDTDEEETCEEECEKEYRW